MSLHLRRASDRYPRACWEPSNDNLVVVSGRTVVGSLKKQIGGTTGERWSWSITCVLVDPNESPRIGCAATREGAQQQLAEAWRTWLKRTNLQEIQNASSGWGEGTPRPCRHAKLASCQPRSAARAPAPALLAGPLFLEHLTKRWHSLAKGVTGRHPLGNAIWALWAGPA